MIDRARERNRALRIARSRARSGDLAAGAEWLTLAAGFAPLEPGQLDAYEAAARAGAAGSFLQPTLDGRVVEFRPTGVRVDVTPSAQLAL